MTEEFIYSKELSKYYQSGFKLNNINFSAKNGEVVAFLGLNGSGKSTLFQLISGNIDATHGAFYFFGSILKPESYKLKRQIGYLPQNMSLPKWATGNEILQYACDLYQIPKAKEEISKSLEYWDCKGFANRPLDSCSHGMQKRIGLSLATIHNPKLLILDEPFSGLDLLHIRALENKILSRQNNSITILSTHILPYVAKLCQKIFIIKAGQIKEIDRWKDLRFDKKISTLEEEFFSEKN